MVYHMTNCRSGQDHCRSVRLSDPVYSLAPLSSLKSGSRWRPPGGAKKAHAYDSSPPEAKGIPWSTDGRQNRTKIHAGPEGTAIT